jgi:hypothetical protein
MLSIAAAAEFGRSTLRPYTGMASMRFADLGSMQARRLSLLLRQVAQDRQVEFLTLIRFDD